MRTEEAKNSYVNQNIITWWLRISIFFRSKKSKSEIQLCNFGKLNLKFENTF